MPTRGGPGMGGGQRHISGGLSCTLGESWTPPGAKKYVLTDDRPVSCVIESASTSSPLPPHFLPSGAGRGGGRGVEWGAESSLGLPCTRRVQYTTWRGICVRIVREGRGGPPFDSARDRGAKRASRQVERCRWSEIIDIRDISLDVMTLARPRLKILATSRDREGPPSTPSRSYCPSLASLPPETCVLDTFQLDLLTLGVYSTSNGSAQFRRQVIEKFLKKCI